jgi:hypothetical protein
LIEIETGIQSHSEMQRLVELHFEKCLTLLTARKEYLLRDLENKVNHNSINKHHPLLSKLFFINCQKQTGKLIQESQTKLKQSIGGCLEMIKVGSRIYNSNKDVATKTWEVIVVHLLVCYLLLIIYWFICSFVVVVCLFETTYFVNLLFFSFSFSLSCAFFYDQETPKEQSNDKIGRISIDLPQTIMITIEMHGKGVLNDVLIVLT